MSYEAMTWAVKVIEQNPHWGTPIRFVLLIMANRANEEGYLYPSVRWIMDRTALGESTIRQATRDLQRFGLLFKEPGKREDGGQGSNDYRLAMGQFVLKLEALGGPTPVHDRPGTVHTVDRGGGAHTKVLKERKEKKGAAARRTPLPDGFAISERVRTWAKKNGFEACLEQHFEHFLGHCKANRSLYADWDEALMNCIRADWGGVRKQAQIAARLGQAPTLAPSAKRVCAYCPAPSVGKVNGRDHCRAHVEYAMEDREPQRAAA